MASSQPPQSARSLRQRVAAMLVSPLATRLFAAACMLGMVSHFGFGCSGWDPRRPFERNAPDVDKAIEMIEAGQFASAEDALSEYLDNESCKKGKLSLSTRARSRHDASFDLGLVLFHLAESYGQRFGELPPDAGADALPGAELPPAGGQAPTAEDKEKAEARDSDLKCGLIASVAIARDTQVPVALRARAAYLAGNFEFLRHDYKAAMDHYDEALMLLPGAPESEQSDSISRDAGFNRAVALRRLEQQQDDAGPEPQPEPQPEPDAGPEDDPQDPHGPDANDGGGDGDGDAGQDAGDKDGNDPADAGPDGGEDDGPDAGGAQNPEPDPGPAEPQQPLPVDPGPAPGQPGGPTGEQGDRVLDQFDQLPTYQQEEARKRGEGRRRGMEDK